MNTTGGNTHGLLREVHNFVLFRIYGCVVQRSLNENMIFHFILLSQKFSLTGKMIVEMVVRSGYWWENEGV